MSWNVFERVHIFQLQYNYRAYEQLTPIYDNVSGTGKK